MDFSSLNFEDTHDVFKNGSYQLCPTTPTTTASSHHHHQEQHQDQHQQNHHHHHADVSVDFFAFADGTADFTHLTATQQQPQQQHHVDYTNVPHLTPDAGKFTSSSVLSGTNPEYMMSPLQISTTHGVNGLNPRPYHLDDIAGFGDDEDFLSPLESPAIAPTTITQHNNSNNNTSNIYDNNNNNNNITTHNHHHHHDAMATTAAATNDTFSPLTSPALQAVPPHHHFNQLSNEQSPESVLQQKLAMIERQQNQLRAAHRHLQGNQHTGSRNNIMPACSSSSSSSSSCNSTTNGSSSSNINHSVVAATATASTLPPTSMGGQEMLPPPSTSPSSSSSSQPPALAAQDGRFLAPATPSLLMKLGRGTGQPMPNHVSPAVDNMASLPAAMLEDNSSKNSKSISKKPTPKRRKTGRSTTAAPFTSPGLAPMAHMSPRPNTDPTIAALVSPAALRPMPTTAPIQSSPRALKPLISPSLQPNGKRLSAIEEQVAAAALATKSNYQNMREGKAKSLGIDFSSSFQSGVENRRSAHKAAEQKRRDTLKQSFDSLRKEIADALVEKEEELKQLQGGELEGIEGAEGENEEGSSSSSSLSVEELKSNKEKEVKQMSKVVLIQHSYEYILRLKAQNRNKDDELNKLREQVRSLTSQLNAKDEAEGAE
ncbi:hypothetical protein BDB00DRAFT_796614 [Zychaea mexicana]|uniref:uncharacterized protein n=1 Tax=Zychaea mexicana TaxID=64656 RepID=UPI0022FF3D22|nr:uncharacterized protein BDB00DRAFT_796614 [Zychaea mexicana]KAI9499377.1 hypothetical protein BDB00DRAFT_796614 [Zychaea mexicana]